jgi:hypothetical protein
MQRAGKILFSSLDDFCMNKSIVMGNIFFKRFDSGSIIHKKISYRVVNFNRKNGTFVDLLWYKNKKAYIIRVVRTREGKVFAFKKRDVIRRVYISLLCLWLNIIFLIKN